MRSSRLNWRVERVFKNQVTHTDSRRNKYYEDQRCADAHIFPAVSLRNRYYGKRSKKICRFLKRQVRNTGRSCQSVRPATEIPRISLFPALQVILILLI